MTTQDRAPEVVAASVERGPEGAELVGSAPLLSGEERVAPTFEATAPNGSMLIRYFSANKDLKIKRHYEVNVGRGWETFPSVTDTLKVLAKDALTWWGMRVGIEGVLALIQKGIVHYETLPSGQHALTVPARLGDGSMGKIVAGLEQVEELMKQFDLTTNEVRDLAADRGQSAHDALETFAKHGILPDPGLFPPEEQDYVLGLRNFLLDVEPEIEGSEVMVASAKHGYAGRYDIRIRTKTPKKIVKHATPVKGAQYATLPPGLYLPDLKTSKDAFDGHCEQLEAYEEASVEMGYEPTKARCVLVVGPPVQGKYALGERRYKLVKSWATFDDYAATLAKYKQSLDMHERYLRRLK